MFCRDVRCMAGRIINEVFHCSTSEYPSLLLHLEFLPLHHNFPMLLFLLLVDRRTGITDDGGAKGGATLLLTTTGSQSYPHHGQNTTESSQLTAWRSVKPGRNTINTINTTNIIIIIIIIITYRGKAHTRRSVLPSIPVSLGQLG